MIRRNVSFAIAALAVSCLVTGCSSSTPSGSGGSSTATSGGGDGESAAPITLQGSGASFPDPLYQRWFKEYSQATSGVTVDYQATGSGAGINDFINKLVDFAGSDAAMTDEEIAQVDAGVQLLPMTAGAVVLAYNLADAPAELKLSREAYVKIFMGEISKWNDPLIATCNEGAELPDTNITVVTRADSSGTTYVFTQHLSEISEAWANGPGTGKTVDWPGSNVAKAPKNAGVTSQIKQINGALGYIEFGYATQTKTAMISLENAAGKFVQPTLETGAAALGNVSEMPENLRIWASDPEGDASYPIVTYTWLLCYKKYEDPAKAEALKSLIKWCLTDGQKLSGETGYLPLPQNIVDIVLQASETIQ